MKDILNNRLDGDEWNEYQTPELRQFMLSNFMQELFISCNRDKRELSRLICQYLSEDSPYKLMGSELFSVFEDSFSEEQQLDMLLEFEQNYKAKNK